MALAAPVEVGTMLVAAARARRRSLWRAVEQVLVAGVGVHRGHQALDDAELVVEGLGHRAEAVGRARGVGDDRVRRRVVVALVDAHHDGDVLVLGGRGDDDLLGAAVDVGLGLDRVGEEAGRLDDHVGTHAGPVELGRVALLEDLEGVAGGGDLGVGVRHVAVEPTQDRVVLHQRRQRLVVGEVVDGDDLDVCARGHDGPEEVAADAAEAVDADANGHCGSSCGSLERSSRPYRACAEAPARRPPYVPVTRAQHRRTPAVTTAGRACRDHASWHHHAGRACRDHRRSRSRGSVSRAAEGLDTLRRTRPRSSVGSGRCSTTIDGTVRCAASLRSTPRPASPG